MKCLLDTHAFLWWVDGDPRLSKKASDLIKNNECAVSLASAWELAIKISLGKLKLALSVDEYFERYTAEYGFDVLAIDLSHLCGVQTLPHHHGDPFDRLLVAQATIENLAIVSADKIFINYGVKCLW